MKLLLFLDSKYGQDKLYSFNCSNAMKTCLVLGKVGNTQLENTNASCDTKALIFFVCLFQFGYRKRNLTL